MPSYSPTANHLCEQAESKSHFEDNNLGIIIKRGKKLKGGRLRRAGGKTIKINALPELLSKNIRMEERNRKSFNGW